MKKGVNVIQIVILPLSIIQRKNKEIFLLSDISAKKKHPAIVAGCSCQLLEDEYLEDQRDQTAVDDAQHDAAQHIGQVVHPEVHA